jgi:hypothetical protein
LLAAIRVNVIRGIHSGYRTGGQRRSLWSCPCRQCRSGRTFNRIF